MSKETLRKLGEEHLKESNNAKIIEKRGFSSYDEFHRFSNGDPDRF